ncbi:hypothetical protein [Nonomuraea sp. NPDC050405]|uniref:hypothetical protein n=1 Tax=Nonomuraea sp. NPDC050405 TaxID=3154509 RepID=UPI0033D679AD
MTVGARRTPLLLAGVLLALYVGAPATAAPETAGATLAAAPEPGTGVPSADHRPAGTVAATSGTTTDTAGTTVGGDHLIGEPGDALSPLSASLLSARAREAARGTEGTGGAGGAGGGGTEGTLRRCVSTRAGSG